MLKSSFQIIGTLILLFVAGTASADSAACPKGTMKVLVAPFENAGSQKSSIAAYSFGMAAALTEALETDPCIRPVAGPLVLIEGLMALYTPQGKIKDPSKLEEYAKSVGATHYVTGSFSGQTWKLSFMMELHNVPVGRSPSSASYYTTVDLTHDVMTSRGTTVRDISMERVHGMLSVGTRTVFRQFGMDAGTPDVAVATIDVIGRPGTSQSYAFLKLSRAYARYFAFDLPEERYVASLKTWKQKAAYFKKRAKQKNREKFTARGLAVTAVNIDPAYGAAQRFYAFHVEKTGKTLAKARLHYELAAKAQAGDYRSLLALGRIEMGFENPKKAKVHLAKAGKIRPGDAETQYQLGLACKAIRGDAASAIAAFEKARSLMPEHFAARGELAALYSEAERHEEAAREYGETVRLNPEDKDAAFKHAASLRAADRLNGAERRLEDYAEQFREDARFHRFHGDVLMMLNRTEDAIAAYSRAYAASKAERRAADLAAGRNPTLLGGEALLNAIEEFRNTGAILDDRSLKYSEAITDAIIDLDRNGGEACKDGHGASSALLATDLRKEFDGYAIKYLGLNERIGVALRNGEGDFLTPRERRLPTAAVAVRGHRLVVSEMDAAYTRNFLPLYRRYKCATYDGQVRAATVAEVYARNRARQTKPSDPGWLPKPMPFSPQITTTSAPVVRFTVDNTDGPEDGRVYVDGTFVGTVAKGAKATFNAKAGVRKICVVPAGGDCEDDGAEHTDYLREGWVIRIRS